MSLNIFQQLIKNIPTDLLEDIQAEISKELNSRIDISNLPDFLDDELSLSMGECFRLYRERVGFNTYSLRHILVKYKSQRKG